MICQGLSERNGQKRIVIRYSIAGAKKTEVLKFEISHEVFTEYFSFGDYVIIAIYDVDDDIKSLRIAYVFHMGSLIRKIRNENEFREALSEMKESSTAMSSKM